MKKLTTILIVLTTLFVCSCRQNQVEQALCSTTEEENIVDLFTHFNSLNLPKFDSIREENVYGLRIEMTTSIDSTLFPFYEYVSYNFYLSKQYSAKNFVCVSVFNEQDCESNLSFYTIDTAFKIVDRTWLFHVGGDCSGGIDWSISYQNYIVSFIESGNRVVYFKNDSTFTVIDEKEVYSLKDTVTGDITIDIGVKTEQTYRINQVGKFVKIDDKSFEKEYSKLFWK